MESFLTNLNILVSILYINEKECIFERVVQVDWLQHTCILEYYVYSLEQFGLSGKRYGKSVVMPYLIFHISHSYKKMLYCMSYHACTASQYLITTQTNHSVACITAHL